MARLRQLSDLRTDAYRFADLENATARFPTSEVNNYINEGVAEFYDLLVRARGHGYFEKNVTMITGIAQGPFPSADGINYPLPPDFFELKLAQCNIGYFAAGTSDTNIALTEFTMRERPELSSYTPGWQGNPFCYRIHGGDPSQPFQVQSTIGTGYTIEFLPRPASGLKVQIFYIPSCPVLINDTDTLDTINGWDRYVTAYASMMMRMKDDLPIDNYLKIMEMAKERINALASHRTTEPSRVTDVRYAFPGRGWRRQRRA